MALKSADHVQAILALINTGTWMSDAVWAYHKDDEDYDEVPLPDRVSRTSGGFVMIEQGRKDWRPNGKKLYANEADFWKQALSHWPRPGKVKKSHWTRDYRRKVGYGGDVIERRFDLFAHPIHAITREVDDEIISIQFYCRQPAQPGQQWTDALIHQWSVPWLGPQEA